MSAYAIHPTKQYRRDLKRLAKQGLDLAKLEEAIDLLAAGEVLPARYRNHRLKGALAGLEECHIAPDWLLTYQRDHGRLLLVLVRTGSHRVALGME